jgi:two-component system phosphate regulon sensor histidine kinase PhoR
MNGSRPTIATAMTALLTSAAWVVAWLLGLVVDQGPWVVRAGSLGVGLLLVAAAAAILLRRLRRDRRNAIRHLEALAALDSHDLHTNNVDDRLPPLEPGNPWRGAAQSIARAIGKHLERLREVEHDHTALEVRYHRVTTQCQRIQTILSGLADPILAIDDYDDVVLANPSAETLFGNVASAGENQALSQLLRCQKLVDLLTATCHRKNTGSRTDEIEIVDSRGQSHWYRVTAAKLAGPVSDRGAEAESGGAVAVFRDIGDQKVLQKRNAEFVSAVSHEMKTPLAGIKAYVELLADGDAEDEETREEFLEVINSQADRLQRLVDNMLNLARIEAGVVHVNKQSRSLNELLEEAMHVVQPAAEARQIVLLSELSPMYLGVLADRDMLLQAAINLLSNAIKYTRAGGRVTLRSRLEDNEVRFEVEDTGVGLNEEDCHRIFEKFYRVTKDKEMASGTGLGLPLAKHIIEDVHSGSLTVTSVLGQGSTFTATLPNAGQMT